MNIGIPAYPILPMKFFMHPYQPGYPVIVQAKDPIICKRDNFLGVWFDKKVPAKIKKPSSFKITG